jgi:hypothetical protein
MMLAIELPVRRARAARDSMRVLNMERSRWSLAQRYATGMNRSLPADEARLI